MPDLFLAALGGLFLLLLGGGLGFWLGQKRGQQDAAKSGRVQEEYDAYRKQVADHFGATAGHFQALGQQVRELYDHMATGAENLCNTEVEGQRIEFRAAASLQPPAGKQADTQENANDIVVDEAAEPATEQALPNEQPAEVQPADFDLTAAQDDDADEPRYH